MTNRPRRSHIPLLFAIAAVLLSGPPRAGAEAAKPDPARDWPQFLGPTRNGVYPAGEGELAETWPADGPPVLWEREVGEGFAGPVVSGGRLVLFHRVGDREVVECMDAATGDVRWAKDYAATYRGGIVADTGPRGTPAIDGAGEGVGESEDARVYTFGAAGMLHCWDLRTGDEVWSVDTKAKFNPPEGFFGAACSPLVEGDAVILNVGGKGSGVVAFDKHTGEVMWRATDDEAGYASPVAATVAGRRQILAFTRAGLVALDTTGHIQFQFPWRSRQHASVNAASPLVVDDTIFLSASYQTGAALLRLTDDGGGVEKVWSADGVLSNHYATSVHHDGHLYGFDGRQDQPPGPRLRCVELATGEVKWDQEPFGAGTVLLAGDRLLVLTEKGQLIMAPATPEKFEPTARAQVLPFECRAYPALAQGLFYARSKDKLVCVDLRAAAAD